MTTFKTSDMTCCACPLTTISGIINGLSCQSTGWVEKSAPGSVDVFLKSVKYSVYGVKVSWLIPQVDRRTQFGWSTELARASEGQRLSLRVWEVGQQISKLSPRVSRLSMRVACLRLRGRLIWSVNRGTSFIESIAIVHRSTDLVHGS
jgi:hypothetical protein